MVLTLAFFGCCQIWSEFELFHPNTLHFVTTRVNQSTLWMSIGTWPLVKIESYLLHPQRKGVWFSWPCFLWCAECLNPGFCHLVSLRSIKPLFARILVTNMMRGLIPGTGFRCKILRNLKLVFGSARYAVSHQCSLFSFRCWKGRQD